MKKTMVIDTSVFIYDPEALFSFENTRIIIPFPVIEELEAFGKFRDESAKNASRALSNIRLLLENAKTKVTDGVLLPNGSELRIEVAPLSNDDRRGKLLTLELLKIIATREPMVFVTKSLGRRVRAEALQIESRDYESKRFSFRSLYRGFRELQVSQEDIENFYKNGYLDLPLDVVPSPNEYFFMSAGENHFALGRYYVSQGKIIALKAMDKSVWGIKPLNTEQRCALDLLLRDDVKLVTLIGQAGSGKTILALAAAMHKVFDKETYNKVLVSRPIVPMGRDIGFLPGLKEDKLMHWMQPIYDNMEVLFSINQMGNSSEALQALMDAKKLEMEALTYIRGRSLPKAFIIIDEAQNLTPHEIKTIISRAGKGTKIVLTGDPTQIDSLYFDENSNGLTYLVGKFHHLALYGHMFMTRTERSELAAAAATIL
ncbi:PhoH family protein [Chlamydia pneumoniae]|uniref:PhoH family protein n=1 Tax=Chlamydia pneumoniae TaxID=83558 RepID=UPI00030E5D56|nr:PhoH family protein [Chlamydia pneumoniae]ETR79990.1 phosphate starvation-inducible protein [Chlamydia pneumoniae B21]